MQRYLSEFLGTFILVFTGCGAIAVSSLTGGEPPFVGIGIIWGLIVMSVIFTIGDISGAHINPAVTIAFWVARRFSAIDVVPYILAQCLGATAAAGLLWYLFGDHAANGLTQMHPQITEAQGFILEILLTWFLMFAVINVSTGAKEKGITAAIAIGGVISIDVLFGGKVTGASMNPARSLGPALVSGDFDQLWVFIAGPIIGAILAIGTAAAIRPGVCCPPPTP